jgi:hypothetical protein
MAEEMLKGLSFKAKVEMSNSALTFSQAGVSRNHVWGGS